jgi:hypothetical protein
MPVGWRDESHPASHGPNGYNCASQASCVCTGLEFVNNLSLLLLALVVEGRLKRDNYEINSLFTDMSGFESWHVASSPLLTELPGKSGMGTLNRTPSIASSHPYI